MRLNLVYRKRWAKLFEFLNKLPTKKYNFQVWGVDKAITDRFGTPLVTKPTFAKCTTAGCTAGWLPTIFPRQWIWSESDGPTLKNSEVGSSVDDFSKFFGFSEQRTGYIFTVPGETLTKWQLDEVTGQWQRTLIQGIDKDVTPKEWIRQAKRILKEYGIEIT